MQKHQKSALALSLLLAVGAAGAANLGQLTVTSHANQNFQASFYVTDVDNSNVSLSARLASEDVYLRYGLTMPETAKGLRMVLVNKNPLTLRVTSGTPAKERAFPLLVELNEGGKKTVRQYNIHLGATGSVEPVLPQKADVKPVDMAPVRDATGTSSVTTPVAARTMQTAPSTTMTPLERMQAKNYNLDRPIVVEHGYTPWSLGVLYQKRYPNASVNQVLVALAVTNPDAFPAGNVRQLKTGATIKAPRADLVQSIDRRAAQEIVQKGLTIEEVASRPMPIAEKPAKREVQKPAKPRARDLTQTSEAMTAPKKAEPRVEEKPAEASPVVTEAVKEPVAQPKQETVQEPVLETKEETKNGIPVAQTPYHGEGAKSEVAGTEPTAQEPAAPTLEIMTEEEELIEEDSSNWFWYLVVVLLLGGAGYLYWKTKTGRTVNFEAFKSAMTQKMGERKEAKVEPALKETTMTVEDPAPTQKAAEEGAVDQKGSTFEEVRVTDVKPVQSDAQPSTQATIAPKTTLQEPAAPHHSHDVASNIFDLVSDTDPMETLQTARPVQGNATTQATQPQQAASSQKAEASMRDSLDMARSFISIGAKTEAFELLQQVAASGTAEEKALAEIYMQQIRDKQ